MANQKEIKEYATTIIIIITILLIFYYVIPQIIMLIKNERDGFKQSRFSSGRSDVSQLQL